MRLSRVGFVLLCLAVASCDGQTERPLSLEEQIAGIWDVTTVTDIDTGLSLTSDFRRSAGDWRFEIEAVGCSAGSAAYTLEIEAPSGEEILRQGRYVPNSGGGILLEDPTRQTVAGGTFAFGSSGARRKMTLTTRGRGAIDDLGSGGGYDLSGDPFGSATVQLTLREIEG